MIRLPIESQVNFAFVCAVSVTRCGSDLHKLLIDERLCQRSFSRDMGCTSPISVQCKDPLGLQWRCDFHQEETRVISAEGGRLFAKRMGFALEMCCSSPFLHRPAG